MAGSAGTAAKAVGLVFSGWIIGKFKFSARTLSAWNVVLGFFYFGTLILFSIVSRAQTQILKCKLEFFGKPFKKLFFEGFSKYYLNPQIGCPTSQMYGEMTEAGTYNIQVL